MNYCTFDRFQGAWLGSIIGAALGQNTDEPEPIKIFHYQAQNWVKTRDAIARSIIENQTTEAQYSQQLRQLLSGVSTEVPSNSGQISTDTDLLNRDAIPSPNFQVRRDDVANISYSNFILALFPLVTFQEDSQYLYAKLITQHNLKLRNIEIEEDILIWSYLLSLALNNRLEAQDANVSTIVKQVLNGVGVRTTSLIEKLEIVSQAWEHGSSLEQLTEKLRQTDNRQNAMTTVNLAIALSFYCFASTPRNFMLSVKRASNLNSNLSVPITALTATISGAYNGVAGIPRNWRLAGDRNQVYQQAQKIVPELFKTWLGTYHIRDTGLLYDPELHAVAFPRIIQPRHGLRIISQKPFLSQT